MSELCKLCSNGKALRNIKNCYGNDVGVCVFCYGSVIGGIEKDGDVLQQSKKVKDISIDIQVGTEQLDSAIEKSRMLMQLLERVDGLTCRIKKDMREIHSPPTFKQ